MQLWLQRPVNSTLQSQCPASHVTTYRTDHQQHSCRLTMLIIGAILEVVSQYHNNKKTHNNNLSIPTIHVAYQTKRNKRTNIYTRHSKMAAASHNNTQCQLDFTQQKRKPKHFTMRDKCSHDNGVVPISASLVTPGILKTRSSHCKTCRCNHNRGVCRWRTRPTPRLWAIPRAALLSVSNLTWNPKP